MTQHHNLTMLTESPAAKYYETLHPIEDWHEDDGPVLWWALPVEEPPYCGTPNDTDFAADNGEGYFTHFTHIVRNSVIESWNLSRAEQLAGGSNGSL